MEPALPSITAAEWLESVGLPLTGEKLESIGFEDCRELWLALLASAKAVEAARFAIYGNGAPAPATIGWLKELSEAVIAAHALNEADTFSRRFYRALGKSTVNRFTAMAVERRRSGVGTSENGYPAMLIAKHLLSVVCR